VKYLVIVNPASGRGQGEQLNPSIQACLEENNLEFDLIRTERPWHAAQLAAQAAREGLDVVVAAGGDGTANEVLNGLMQAKSEGFGNTAMGIISTGTGNDFAFGMGIPIEMKAACRSLKEARRRVIDVGIVWGSELPAEGRYFGNAVGIGFDAAGTIVSQKITWARGFLAYFISVIQTIFFYYKAPTLEIAMDDQTVTQPSLMVSVMNGTRLGGGFKIAPEASPDDGLFDLCIAHQATQARMFTLIPHFLKGTQASQPEIKMAQSRKVVIIAVEGTIPAHIDGEIICTEGEKLSIEILPAQIEVIGVSL